MTYGHPLQPRQPQRPPTYQQPAHDPDMIDMGQMVPAKVQAPSAGRKARAPEYAGLKIASSILMIFAMLGYIAGAILLMIGIAASMKTASHSARAVDDEFISRGIAGSELIYTLILAGMQCAVAALLHGASAACIALRDLTRNSFR